MSGSLSRRRTALWFAVFVGVSSFVGPLITSYAGWISDIVNTPVPYAVTPFTAGLIAGAVMRGAGWGVFACVAMVLAFYLGDELSSETPFNLVGLSVYGAQALLVGPVLGALGGAVARWLGKRTRVAITRLFAAVVVGYQVAEITVPDQSTVWDDLSLGLNALVWSAWPVAASVLSEGDDPR